MAEVGAVSVKVVPDADGFQRALKRQLATQRVAFQVGDASKAGKDGAKYALSFQRAANSLFKGWKPNIGSTKIVAMGAKHGAAYASAFKAAVGDIDIDVDVDRSGLLGGRGGRGGGGANSFSAALGAAAGSSKGLLKTIGPVGAGAGAAAAAFAAAAGSVAAYGAAAGAALSSSGKLEQKLFALETLTGSSAAATELLNDSLDFAIKTPFDTDAVISGVQQLKAYGFATEDLLPILQDVGDASAALSLGSAGIGQISRALGQIQTKGKVAAQEMLQLAEAGVPAWQILADKLSENEGRLVTVAEAMKLGEEGALEAGWAVDALRDGMQELYGGSLAKQSSSFLGTLEAVKDSLTVDLQKSLLPVLPAVADAVREILPFVQDLSQSLGSGFAAGLPGFIDGLKRGADSLSEIGGLVQDFLADAGPKLGRVAANLADTIANVAPVASQVADEFLTWLELITELGAKISSVLDLIPEIPKELSVYDKALRFLQGDEEFFGNRLDGAQASLTSTGTKIVSEWEAIVGDLEKVAPEIDWSGVEAGNLTALQGALVAINNNENSLADKLGWSTEDIAEFKSDIEDALKGLKIGQVADLTGRVTIDTNAEALRGEAEESIRTISQAIAQSQVKLPFKLDWVGLQQGSVAEFEKILGLSNKKLSAVLGVDITEVKAARKQIQSLINRRMFITIDGVVDKDAVRRATAEFQESVQQNLKRGRKTNRILVGLGIDRKGLQEFSPEAIRALVEDASLKDLIKIGLAPDKKSAQDAKNELEGLLAGGAGTGEIPQLIDITVDDEEAQNVIDDVNFKLNELSENDPEPTATLNDEATPQIGIGMTLQNVWGALKTTSTHTVDVIRKGFAPTDLGDVRPSLVPESGIQGLRSRTGAGPVGGGAAGGGMARSGGEGGGTVSGAAANPLDLVVRGLNKNTLYGKVVIERVKKFAKELNVAIDDVVEAASMKRRAPQIGNGFGQYVAGLDADAAALQKASFALTSAQNAVGRAEQKILAKIAKIEDAASERAAEKKKFKGEYLFEGNEQEERAALKKQLARIQARDRKLAKAAEKQRLAQEKLARKQAKAQERIRKQQQAWQLEDLGNDALGQDVETLRSQLTDLKRGQQIGEYVGVDLGPVRKQIREAIKAAKELDKLRQGFAKEDILSSASDAVESGDFESILSQLEDLSRAQQLGELTINPNQYDAVVAGLTASVEQAKKQAKLDLLEGVFDPRSIRSVTDSAGLADFIQGVEDSFDDLAKENPELITPQQTAQMSAQLNAQRSLLESHVAKITRIAEARDFKKSVEDAWLGSVDANTRSPRSLTRRLQRQTEAMQKYAADLKGLELQGLSQDASKYLAEMSPDVAAKFAARLLSGGQDAIREFNEAVSGYTGAADVLGGTAAGVAFSDTGVAAGAGFIEGLESQESAIRAAMEGIAEGMLATWKRVLGIASPSKVFAAAAAEIPAGIVAGVDSGRSSAEAAMSSLWATPSTQSFARIGAPSVPSQGVAGEVNITVNPRESQDEVSVARAVGRELSWIAGW